MKNYLLAVAFLAAVQGIAAGDAFWQYDKLFQVGPNPSAIAAPDLNDDGLPDIVTANTGQMSDPRRERPANDEVSVLIATKMLEYNALPPLRTDFAPYALAIGNVDTMKAPEILAASFISVRRQDISLFRNVGDNLFESYYFKVPEETLPYNRMRDGDHEPVFTRPGITALQLADFNQDGYRDVIATGWSSDVLIYFPGVDKTYFGAPKFISTPPGPRDIRVADFDGDKLLDLAVVLYSANEIGLWKGDGKGNFLPMNRFSTRGKMPTKLALADFNGDSKLDIAVSHSHTDDSIVIFYGDGQFSFSNSQEILLGPDRNVLEHEVRDILVADFNKDGRPDIAAACFGSKQIQILFNDSGTYPVSFRKETYKIEAGRPRALCTADFNNDGAPDIAAALWESNAVTLLIANAPGKSPTTEKTEKGKPKKTTTAPNPKAGKAKE